MASATGAPAHLMQEVVLDSDYKEQERFDNLADMFAIIRTLQFLEKAQSRQMVDKSDYDTECDKLLQNYQSSKWQNGGDGFDLADFAKTYNLECPLALHRIDVGVNGSREHGIAGSGGGAGGDSAAKCTSNVTEQFIQIMDVLEVQEASKELLKPELTKLLDCLATYSKVATLPASYTGKAMVLKWIAKLDPMGALDEFDDGEKAELDMDLQEHYRDWKTIL